MYLDHLAREKSKAVDKEYEKAENDLKALQSVGQVVGDVLKQLTEDHCELHICLWKSIWQFSFNFSFLSISHCKS